MTYLHLFSLQVCQLKWTQYDKKLALVPMTDRLVILWDSLSLRAQQKMYRHESNICWSGSSVIIGLWYTIHYPRLQRKLFPDQHTILVSIATWIFVWSSQWLQQFLSKTALTKQYISKEFLTYYWWTVKQRCWRHDVVISVQVCSLHCRFAVLEGRNMGVNASFVSRLCVNILGWCFNVTDLPISIQVVHITWGALIQKFTN